MADAYGHQLIGVLSMGRRAALYLAACRLMLSEADAYVNLQPLHCGVVFKAYVELCEISTGSRADFAVLDCERSETWREAKIAKLMSDESHAYLFAGDTIRSSAGFLTRGQIQRC